MDIITLKWYTGRRGERERERDKDWKHSYINFQLAVLESLPTTGGEGDKTILVMAQPQKSPK